MRARMGPYHSHLTAWSVAETLLFFLDDEHPLVEWLADRLSHPTLMWLMETYNTWRSDRRIRIQVDPWDSWNADHTIASIALPVLIQLRANGHGSPHVDDEDVPEHLRLNLTEEQIANGETGEGEAFHDRWHWVMDEIIWALTQVVNDDSDDEFYHWEEKMSDEPEDWETMSRRLTVDHEGLQAHQDRINRGLRFFGKYFQALWD